MKSSLCAKGRCRKENRPTESSMAGFHLSFPGSTPATVPRRRRGRRWRRGRRHAPVMRRRRRRCMAGDLMPGFRARGRYVCLCLHSRRCRCGVPRGGRGLRRMRLLHGCLHRRRRFPPGRSASFKELGTRSARLSPRSRWVARPSLRSAGTPSPFRSALA